MRMLRSLAKAAAAVVVALLVQTGSAEAQQLTGAIEYQVHLANFGWSDWISDGAEAGTVGEGRALEAFKVRLKGEAAVAYTVEYRGRMTKKGWTDVVREGEICGTAGKDTPLEAFTIRLVPKGSPARPLRVRYRGHSAKKGWGDFVVDGQEAGITGKKLRLEAMTAVIEVAPPPQDKAPPKVQIVNPKNGFGCQVQQVQVDVDVTDDFGVTRVLINGQPAQSAGGSRWTAMVALADGSNNIAVEAYDAAGNIGRSGCAVTADWTPPQVQAEAVAAVTVRGRVDDPSAQVTIDGQAVQLGRDGSFAVQVRAPQSGFVTLIAVDRSGNRSEVKIPVR